MNEEQIRTPFTYEQVKKLNQYQRSGKFHPYTCGDPVIPRSNHSDEEGILFATPDGLICECGYKQHWAWKWTAE